MYMRKPVIVSSAKPLKRIVEETNCGLIFESGNPENFADIVLQLQDSDERLRLGENGYQAVINKYNWQHDAKRLVSLYEQIKTK
jgi:glycosyltransferase involved in cell wall biosynthesis